MRLEIVIVVAPLILCVLWVAWEIRHAPYGDEDR